MNRKIILFLALATIPLSGSDCDGLPSNYNGSVKINKTNGAATSVEVCLPCTGNVVYINSRKDAAALVAQLESILADVKAASDQFPVDEAQKQPEKGAPK